MKTTRKQIVAMIVAITMILNLLPAMPVHADETMPLTGTVPVQTATGDVITVTPVPVAPTPVVPTVTPITPLVKPVIPSPVQGSGEFSMDSSEGLTSENVMEYIDSIAGQWFNQMGEYRADRASVQSMEQELEGDGYITDFYFYELGGFVGKNWDWTEAKLSSWGFTNMTLVKDVERNLLVGYVPFGGDDRSFIEIKFNIKSTKVEVIQFVVPSTNRTSEEVKDVAKYEAKTFTGNKKFSMQLLNNNDPNGYMVSGYSITKATKGTKTFACRVVTLATSNYDMEQEENSEDNNMERTTMYYIRYMASPSFEDKPAQ